MIKKNDRFECSKCRQEVNPDNDSEYCQNCGHDFNPLLLNNSNPEKHIAVDYREATFNGKDVVLAEIFKDGVLKNFMVPVDSQIAYRVKYCVENELQFYMEDGLMSKTPLFDMSRFENITVGNQRFIADKRLV